MDILLIEDDAGLSYALASSLQCRRITIVASARNAVLGRTLAEHATCDAAILDYRLADGDGGSVGAALKRRGIPFLWLTSLEAAEFDALGAPLLQKPAPAAAIAATLERLVAHPPAARP
ncbi:MAG TPA: hypothetical protein VED40_02590 [Azospirillaceae bacterium]|nr:hypothetical protein [Azospirillaceae bacterium]